MYLPILMCTVACYNMGRYVEARKEVNTLLKVGALPCVHEAHGALEPSPHDLLKDAAGLTLSSFQARCPF